MSTRIRFRALAAFFAVTTGALVLTAAPAQAEPRDNPGQSCWLDTSTSITRCFADEAALQDAVADSGGILVEEGEDLAARRPAGLLTNFVIARLYDGGGYTSSTFVITNLSSTICSTSSVSGNLPAFNDVTSSFHSYFGCSTRIYENNGSGGAGYGWFVDAASVGALNNLASSYNVT
jgi:hypothetical protein